MIWATHVLQWTIQRAAKPRGQANPIKLFSDCSLQLDLKRIVDQHATVNTFPGLVHTARHTTRVCNTRSRWSNHLELAVEGGTNDWGEVVTR